VERLSRSETRRENKTNASSFLVLTSDRDHYRIIENPFFSTASIVLLQTNEKRERAKIKSSSLYLWLQETASTNEGLEWVLDFVEDLSDDSFEVGDEGGQVLLDEGHDGLQESNTNVQTGNSSLSISTNANEFNASPVGFGDPSIDVLDDLKEDGEDALVDLFDLSNKWSQNLEDVDTQNIGRATFTKETTDEAGELLTEQADGIVVDCIKHGIEQVLVEEVERERVRGADAQATESSE